MYPKVSIVVPNYNHQEFLKVRLDSIFNQTFQDFEVLIFDDASSDDSLLILNEYKSNLKVTHFVINSINSGSPFKNWKEGMRLASGQYIWIAETDDFAATDFLEQQLKAIDNHCVAVAKTIVVNDFTISQTEVCHPAFEKNTSIVLQAKQFLTSPIKNVSCILFQKPSQKELEAMIFDSFPLMGDQVFYYEYFKDKKLIFNQNTTAYFRRISNSLSNFNQNKGLNYFINYYNQHKRFSTLLENEIAKEKIKKYNQKHFNKIRNNASFQQKFSLKYLWIILKHFLNR
ncbi:glycosyltransferase family 2 protein [Flavobacterium sp.]|uniref:glycosyltransferase family 2 protein n=1 Tax=Flavobacterium sp. TaxID=239 RepID=UPI0026033AAA|nr:glycosyltransferase family 2 protein [Flavobacterium sp.]